MAFETRQRGATKAQLEYRARKLGLCRNCGKPESAHTVVGEWCPPAAGETIAAAEARKGR